jgi:hypothetical protein
MRSRGVLIGLCIGGVLAVASPARAGGSFESIVAVGANGSSRTIHLRQAGLRSEEVLTGSAVAVPRGGFIRIYPMIGGLPADPGRYYPTAHVLCLYWSEPVSNCMRLGATGIKLLAPLTRLPLRHQTPTEPVEVRYRSRPIRYANGNIFAALELARERRSIALPVPPRHAVRLTVRWDGPEASNRPSAIWLAPHRAYSRHRYARLPLGTWCYLTLNLPHASVSLLEANSRICG